MLVMKVSSAWKIFAALAVVFSVPYTVKESAIRGFCGNRVERAFRYSRTRNEQRKAIQKNNKRLVHV